MRASSLPPPDAEARRSRGRVSAILALAASMVAWLGPAWGLPFVLLAGGTIVLALLLAAQLFYRGAPGSFGRRYVAAFFVFAAFLGWGLVAERETEPANPVLIETFLPPGTDLSAWLRTPPGEPVRRRVTSGEAFAIVCAADSFPGRVRLGYLCGLAEPYPAEDLRGLERDLVAVNGVFLAPRQELEAAVEGARRSAGGCRMLLLEPPQRAADGGLAARVRAAAGLTFALLVLGPPAPAPGEAAWRRLLAVLSPSLREERPGGGAGASYHLRFSLPAEPAAVEALLVAHRDLDVAGLVLVSLPPFAGARLGSQ